MTYQNYSLIELDEIRFKTRTVSSDPYKLFVAMVLLAIEEFAAPEDEDEFNLWYKSLPKSDVDNIIEDCIMDFCHAIGNKMKLDVAGTLYSLRNIDKVKPRLLKQIFNFPESDGDVVITPNGIYDVAHPLNDHSSVEENKNFAKRLWLFGSTEDGWYELTDMEAAVFCWIQFARKADWSLSSFLTWYNKYEKFIDVSLDDIKSCLSNDDTMPRTVFSFSADKINEYNKAHNVLSKIHTVSLDEAEKFWLKD